MMRTEQTIRYQWECASLREQEELWVLSPTERPPTIGSAWVKERVGPGKSENAPRIPDERPVRAYSVAQKQIRMWGLTL